jgi:hypothetical protein
LRPSFFVNGFEQRTYGVTFSAQFLVGCRIVEYKPLAQWAPTSRSRIKVGLRVAEAGEPTLSVLDDPGPGRVLAPRLPVISRFDSSGSRRTLWSHNGFRARHGIL